MQKLIYVCDDDENIRELLSSYLTGEGFRVEAYENGIALMNAIARQEPDMIILDVMMPGMSGLDVCRELRKSSEVPIIFVSARHETFDRILGLELGSDDYIAKPFSPRELLARMKTVFRRVGESEAKPAEEPKAKDIQIGDILIRTGERSVFRDGEPVDFTIKEYELFYYLAANKNMVFNREQLVTAVWGEDYEGDCRSVDDLIKRIRKKLRNVGSQLEITTVWGYGYKINA
jgi:DNA-binding response OmpR family regulator